jgi:hypothetical protein
VSVFFVRRASCVVLVLEVRESQSGLIYGSKTNSLNRKASAVGFGYFAA